MLDLVINTETKELNINFIKQLLDNYEPITIYNPNFDLSNIFDENDEYHDSYIETISNNLDQNNAVILYVKPSDIGYNMSNSVFGLFVKFGSIRQTIVITKDNPYDKIIQTTTEQITDFKALRRLFNTIIVGNKSQTVTKQIKLRYKLFKKKTDLIVKILNNKLDLNYKDIIELLTERKKKNKNILLENKELIIKLLFILTMLKLPITFKNEFTNTRSTKIYIDYNFNLIIRKSLSSNFSDAFLRTDNINISYSNSNETDEIENLIYNLLDEDINSLFSVLRHVFSNLIQHIDINNHYNMIIGYNYNAKLKKLVDLFTRNQLPIVINELDVAYIETPLRYLLTIDEHKLLDVNDNSDKASLRILKEYIIHHMFSKNLVVHNYNNSKLHDISNIREENDLTQVNMSSYKKLYLFQTNRSSSGKIYISTLNKDKHINRYIKETYDKINEFLLDLFMTPELFDKISIIKNSRDFILNIKNNLSYSFYKRRNLHESEILDFDQIIKKFDSYIAFNRDMKLDLSNSCKILLFKIIQTKYKSMSELRSDMMELFDLKILSIDEFKQKYNIENTDAFSKALKVSYILDNIGSLIIRKILFESGNDIKTMTRIFKYTKQSIKYLTYINRGYIDTMNNIRMSQIESMFDILYQGNENISVTDSIYRNILIPAIISNLFTIIEIYDIYYRHSEDTEIHAMYRTHSSFSDNIYIKDNIANYLSFKLITAEDFKHMDNIKNIIPLEEAKNILNAVMEIRKRNTSEDNRRTVALHIANKVLI